MRQNHSVRRHSDRFLLSLCVSSLCSLCLCGSFSSAQQPALTTLEAFPPDINLDTSRGRQSFVVKATYADGITRDVTSQAKLVLANPALARLDKSVVYPVGVGRLDDER